jgi:ERCC4-type nuclease
VFTVKGDSLFFNGVEIGPRSDLYADSGELSSLNEADGVRHLRMPGRIDLVMVAGDRVVGAESKRPLDLIGSTRSRRLARQIRMLQRSVDVPCVVLRGGVPSFSDNEIRDVITNLVSLQQLGVTLLPCPSGDRDTLSRLVEYRAILATGSRAALKAIAGTDERKIGGGSWLGRVKGVGPKMEKRLRVKFGTLASVIAATDDDLRKAGVSATVIRRLREMME